MTTKFCLLSNFSSLAYLYTSIILIISEESTITLFEVTLDNLYILTFANKDMDLSLAVAD